MGSCAPVTPSSVAGVWSRRAFRFDIVDCTWAELPSMVTHRRRTALGGMERMRDNRPEKAHTHTCAHIYGRTRRHTHTYIHMHARAHAHTNTHARTHTETNTQVVPLPLSPPLPPSPLHPHPIQLCLIRPSTPCTQDADVVEKLTQAGAIIIGKTNVPELAGDFQVQDRRACVCVCVCVCVC